VPHWCLALAVMIGAGTTTSHAQQPTGVLAGRVVDELTGRPVAGATVEVIGLDLRTVADAAGRFVLDAVPVGLQRVLVRAIGYAAATRANLAIGSGKPFDRVPA
jgi:hypothetical protein